MKNINNKKSFAKCVKFSSMTYSPLLRYKYNAKAMKERRMRNKTRLSKLNEFARALESIDNSRLLTTGVTDCVNAPNKSSLNLSKRNPKKKGKNAKNNDQRNLLSETSQLQITIPSVIKMPINREICKPNVLECAYEDAQKCLNLNKYNFNSLESLMPAGIDKLKCEKKNSCTSTKNFLKMNEEEMESVNFKRSDSVKETLTADQISNGDCLTVSANKSTTPAKVYTLNNSSCLILLEQDDPLYFVGVCEIELLKGSVEVLGFEVNAVRSPQWVFSLQGSSHLFLKSTFSFQNNYNKVSKLSIEMLTSVGLPELTAKKIVKESDNASLLIVRKHKSHYSCTVWPFVFQSHLPFLMFPPSDLLEEISRPYHIVEEKIDCLLGSNLQEINLREFKEAEEWKTLHKEIFTLTNHSKTVLCGGKGVGKSSLLRYLANKCLSLHGKVLVIDFDLGQCEFTVPGCISVVLVEKPLLGPNYSHLMEPVRSVFLGEVDVTKCPESYIEGSTLLIDFALDKFSDIPWLINTMGFTRGFGVKLNCGIIQYLQPTHVVQIQSKDKKLNFPSVLYPEFVRSENEHSSSKTKELFYKLHIVQSAAEIQRQGIRGMSPLETRNLVILSYLSKMLSAENLYLTQVTPYKVHMDYLELRTTDPSTSNLSKQDVAACLNGNLVALCDSKKNKDYPNCHGFGIVRGIDWGTSTLYIVTPAGPAALAKTDCLVKGNVALPESVYYAQAQPGADRWRGHVPYLARTSGRPAARFARRDFRQPPKTQRTDNSE